MHFLDKAFALLAVVACMAAPAQAQSQKLAAGTAVKLDTMVNSGYEEIMPILSPDRQKLYFVRSLSPANTGGKDAGQDVWVSTLGADGKWGRATNLGMPINNEANNAICGISADGNTIYLTNIYERKKRMEPGISMSKKGADGAWSVPVPLKITDFVIQRGYLGAFMAADERTLLLTMKSDDAVGREDLYVSFKQPDNTFSKPFNLGKTINTVGFEISPVYDVKDSTLYFASNGHEGYGDADIFRTKRQDLSWTKWSKPENMGPQTNSDGFDAYLMPAYDSLAYFVKEDPEVRFADIYLVKLEDPAVSKARRDSALLAKQNAAKGKGKKKNGEGGEEDPDELEKQKKYLTDKDPRSPEEIYRDLSNRNRQAHGDFESILFDFGKATLRPEGKKILAKAVKYLKDNPAVGIELVGHTDSVGSDFGNQILSDKRSYAAKEYLLKNGISRNRILNHGFGKQIHVDANTTDAGRQQNRRCELNLLLTKAQFDAFREQYQKKEVKLPEPGKAPGDAKGGAAPKKAGGK